MSDTFGMALFRDQESGEPDEPEAMPE